MNMKHGSRVKALVGQAFKELRRGGFIARQGYMCCMGCASNGIWNYWLKSKGKSRIHATVYYHKQDLEGYRSSGDLDIRYSAMNEFLDEFDREEAMIVVGREVFNTLRENGLHPIWNGNPGSTIEVSEEFEALLVKGC